MIIDLKIEEFKPEFAGKMNFYLSAVDSQLRHMDDAPTIGIILCKQSNGVIVEYALRDAAKPMGVANYVLGEALPAPLQSELPTAAELAKDWPSLSLVKVRIDIERALQSLMSDRGIAPPRPSGLALMIRELHRSEAGISITADLFRAVGSMDAAAHGIEVPEAEARESERIGLAFLELLRKELG